VAQQFGGGKVSAKIELNCTRKVNFKDIRALLKERSDAGTTPTLTFVPTFDNRTKFANYMEKALMGNFTKNPAVVDTTIVGGRSFVLPYDLINDPPLDQANSTTLGHCLCPAVNTIQGRFHAGPHVQAFCFCIGVTSPMSLRNGGKMHINL
jgi:acetylcholinesterase